MKLKLIAFTLFLFSVLVINAQQFNAGFLAGVNASQVSGDGYSGFNKAGILIGLYSNVSISQKIDLQFEINYSQKGSRKNPKTSEDDTDFFLLRMNYINIPVLAQFQKKKFTYETGVYIGQLISDHIENQDGPSEIAPELNQFKPQDLGILVGINYNFTDNLIMNWRLSSSVIPFRNYDSNASFQFDSGMYHHYLSFNFRYQFLGNEK